MAAERDSNLEWSAGEIFNACCFFDANGGEAVDAAITTDQGVITNGLPIAEKEGHSFAGWWTEPVGGSRIDVETHIDDTCTLFAHWDVDKYSIIFDAKS